MKSRTWIAVAGLALGVLVVGEVGDAWARARGGGGGTGRGSRSYSAPARPSPAAPTTPSSPSRSLNQPGSPAQSPAMPGRGLFGGLMGGLAGFALGGLLGSLLFGGLGHGMGFGGIGLMDILLIGGGVALLIMFLRRRRAQEPQPAYAGMGGSYREPPAPAPPPTATVTAAPVEVDEVERGLGHIASMDGRFDASALTSFARDMFVDVQAAVTTRDLSRIREKVTPELYAELQTQCDQARATGRTNRVERVDLRQSQISEAWQETGRDYVTVYLAGSLIDYTVEDATGAVVAGSATQRENVEEFWTFTRPVGPGPWRLSAIQS